MFEETSFSYINETCTICTVAAEVYGETPLPPPFLGLSVEKLG